MEVLHPLTEDGGAKEVLFPLVVLFSIIEEVLFSLSGVRAEGVTEVFELLTEMSIRQRGFCI